MMGKFASSEKLEEYLEMVAGSAAPVKSLLHFAQNIQKGEFGHFDKDHDSWGSWFEKMLPSWDLF